MMLSHLPEAQNRAKPPSILTAFYAVLISYMASYIISRLAEMVRVGNVVLKEKLSFSGVLGTVISDRLLDLVTSALAFLSLFWVARPKLVATYHEYIMPFLGRAQTAIWIAAIVIPLGAVLGIWLLRRFRSKQDHPAASKIQSLIHGLATLYKTPQKPQMLIATLGIWLCYAFVADFSARLLHFDSGMSWTLADSWTILIIGSLGILVPTPGGAGSYHIITRWALVTLWGIADEKAVAFAFFTHAIQLVIYTFSGFFALIVQDLRFSSIINYKASTDKV